MASQELFIVIAASLLFALVGGWLSHTLQQRKKYKLPPLVPGVPIFGNSFQVPAKQQGPWAKVLAEKHGEMYEAYVP